MEYHKELQIFVNHGYMPQEFKRTPAPTHGYLAPCCRREFNSKKKVREHISLVLQKDFTRCTRCEYCAKSFASHCNKNKHIQKLQCVVVCERKSVQKKDRSDYRLSKLEKHIDWV